jgi:leader peptidase (prepilin peptidase)/N-methyltransferase
VPPFVVGLGLAGLAWGIVADRIAARWPEHEDGVQHRAVDWRTIVVALVGAGSLAAVGLRFGEPIHQVLFAAWAAVLVLLLATDLDQRLLPDVLTLPLVPIAVLLGLTGWNPLVADGLLWPAVAAVGFPLGLFLLSIPFGPGAIGMGDLKLLVSVGLIAGPLRTFQAVLLGAVLSGVVILVLMALRRITRRSYIPYGPFLIAGTLWAVLVAG